MNIKQEICKLLREIGPGRMMSTAYDTAWIACLKQLGEPMGEQAMEWLRANQLADGSWGASKPQYYHDRVISTLAAINALALCGEEHDRPRLQQAQSALTKASKGLALDPAGETGGFELIVPTLITGTKVTGKINSTEESILKRLVPYRAAKLAALPEGMINRTVTLAHSSEMAGTDEQHLLDVGNLQEYDGSVSHSPSATAYFALHVRRGDVAALEYLNHVTVDGTAPAFAPFDVFEPAWTLWNLSLTASLDEELLTLCHSAEA